MHADFICVCVYSLTDFCLSVKPNCKRGRVEKRTSCSLGPQIHRHPQWPPSYDPWIFASILLAFFPLVLGYETSFSKSEQNPAGLTSEPGCLSCSDLPSAVGRLPLSPRYFCQMRKIWIWAPFVSKKKMDFLRPGKIHCCC